MDNLRLNPTSNSDHRNVRKPATPLVRVSRYVAVLVLAIFMLRIAWIGDDSLISLRAILNLTHGWGAGFNAFEAVQSATHPLWFLLWMALGSITGEWIISILLLSVLLAATAVLLILHRVNNLTAIIIVTGSLILSNAFMEYTTSGLENPLAYLLVAMLILFTTRSTQMTIGSQILFGLTISGLILTRFDLVLLVGPAVMLVATTAFRSWRLTAVLLASASTPIAIWFAWSWHTYSSLLPNTLTAKQNASIPRSEFIIQGFRYLWISIERDPVTILILVTGLSCALIVKSLALRAWMAGVVLYLGYVVWIGGDFMVGRFLAVPVLVAVSVVGIVLGSVGSLYSDRQAVQVGVLVAAVTLILTSIGLAPTSLSPPTQPRWEFAGSAGVADEYGYHLSFSRDLRHAVMRLGSPVSVPPLQTAESIDPAVTINELRSATSLWPTAPSSGVDLPTAVVPQYGFLGTVGILTGPTVHLIDQYALTDRFLAAQPFTAEPFQWRIGHFNRLLPPGYVEAVASGDPSKVEDPFLQGELRSLWSRIR